MAADPTIAIPALRSELRIRPTKSERSPWLIEDPILLQRVPLDSIGKSIVDHLKTSQTPQSLHAAVSGDHEQMLAPSLLYRHVEFLRQYGLFEGVRATVLRDASQNAQSVESQPDLIQEFPLNFAGDLRHACQACGSCCSATDVGPILPKQAERIRAYPWSDVIDSVAPGEDVFREEPHGESSILLTRMNGGQCVFLADDKRCLIHRHLGVDAKPTPCRQFPYVFSRVGDRVDVSLSMECRAYWRAKQAATDPSEQQDSLRELIRLGAPVHVVPELVQVESGLAIHRSHYLSIEQALIEVVTNSEDESDPIASIHSMVLEASSQLTAIMEPIQKDESAWTNPREWSRMLGCAIDREPEDDRTMETLLRDLVSFCDEAVSIAREKDRADLADRFSFLAAASRAALDPPAFERMRWEEPTISQSIINDLLVSGIFSKELVRHPSIEFGVGMLAIRAVLTVYGACHRAREACRVEVTVQDLIDSMVTLSKMLRERAVLDVLRDHEKFLFSLLVRDFIWVDDLQTQESER